MPTYVYKFIDSGETIEIYQAFSDDALTEAPHPSDGKLQKVKKVFTPVGITFKGGGFYKTDSANSSKTSASGSASGTKSTETSATSTSESKSETKSESKSGESATATPAAPSAPVTPAKPASPATK